MENETTSEARTRTQHWDKRQIKDFVKQAKKPWGDFAWRQLGDEIKEGLLAAVAIGVVTGQAADSIAIDAVKQLVDAMRAEAGLYEVA